MDRMEYTRAVATMRVYEKRLLDSARIDRLVDSKDPVEAYKIISETEYGKSMGGVKDPADFEKVLKNELESVYKDMYSMVADKELIDILALKYDYQNLKMLLKNWALSKETEREQLSDMGTVPAGELKTLVEQEDYKSLPDLFREAVITTKEQYEKTKDPQYLDIMVDKIYLKHLKELEERWKDVPTLGKYVNLIIDRYNILSMLRAKKQDKDIKFLRDLIVPIGEVKEDDLLASFTEAGENLGARFNKYSFGQFIRNGFTSFNEKGSLKELEKEFDNLIMDNVKPSKKIVFGPEPLFSYIVAKERENQILRIIMVSKLNNIPSEKIRERLRDIYV